MLLLLASLALADEGMWLPEQLPEIAPELRDLGLELPAEQLADPLGHPMGAVAWLGFCTASFLSPEGLALTNHHCVGGYLQMNSDAERDLGRDGFLATSRADELWAGPGARMVVVERIDDVTERVHGAIPRRVSDAERARIVDRVHAEILAECEAEQGRRCRVSAFHGGLEYRLLTGREIRDVRLVYAPPTSVGQLGGDVDNWMWPRHGADFSVLRAYVAPDGSTADYSPDNVPYQPAHHLEVSWDGVDEGDFVMVLGYPGATQRHRLAAELEHALVAEIPQELAMYARLLPVLYHHAEADPEGAARLSAPIDWLENGRKYYRGLGQGLARSNALEARRQREAALEAWIDADRARKRRYRPALEELRERLAERHADGQRQVVVDWALRAVELLARTHEAYRLAVEREKPDLDRAPGFQDRDLETLRAGLNRLERTLWLPAERDLLAAVQGAALALPADRPIPPLAGADLDALFDAPALADAEARLALLDMDRAAFEASDDPWVRLAVDLERWLAPRREEERAYEGAMLRLRPVALEALLAQAPGAMYADANDTLRVTVGTVQGAVARDGVYYLPFTTLGGLVAKAGPPPFDVPPDLLERATAGPSSPWADAGLGDVPVNYLTTLDSTGGNSGSPTLDGQGRFVGLLFDGTFESVAADWAFDPASTRSIHMDVRYLGWILENEPGARWIFEELGGPER